MKRIYLIIALAVATLCNAAAQYRNPIINADVPDMSVCRAGNYYYMISTTMHLMPGAPVMRSTDMKHWETVSYVFPRIDDAPCYSLLGGTAYGQGQWASSIRYHKGRFYVWFTANGAPYRGFIYTAEKAEGPWTLLSRPKHMHDGSLFFDDDGKTYIIYGTGELAELKDDLSDVKPDGTQCRIFERDADEHGLLEGSAMIKHNGKYYLMMISWPPGSIRREVCYRADKITGPYEKKVILETHFAGYGGVGQGCIVDDTQGNWHALIFQDRGGIGRVPCLMPCTWKDGWPMLGDEKGNVPDDMTQDYMMPDGICSSDNFDDNTLKLCWQWNHNPEDRAWSLNERKGWMRLKTARRVDNIYLAPNTLTQRMTGPRCSGSVRLDVSHMKDGDRCGLAAFNGHSGMMTIERENGKYSITMETAVVNLGKDEKNVESVDTKEYARLPLNSTDVTLRIDADFEHGRDIATFSYKTGNGEWQKIGVPFKMIFDFSRLFMGTRFAIFNYATRKTGGWVDADFFKMEMDNRTLDSDREKYIKEHGNKACAQTAVYKYFKYTGNDERFDKSVPKGGYLNPLIAGFAPDPSICRKGDTYYMVNSSFTFFPGVPIYTSKNLTEWEHLGYVLDRESQLPLAGQRVSGGIFAPAISYNEKNKTFYMITTNVGAGNFYVKSKNPAEGWSEPIYLRGVGGIDPSFFFDKDGKGYIVNNDAPSGKPNYEGERSIWIHEFDVKGDSLIGEQREILRGGTHVQKNPIWIEGPHLFKVGKYYYLMCAEGGTGDWHSEVILRAKNPMGPWEEYEGNPILTQRTGLDPNRKDIVTSAGHADIVQTPKGEWYAVFLGCRPYEGDYYNTGRDTYMLPVTWKDGWPVILEKGTAIPTVCEGPKEYADKQTENNNMMTGNFSYTDNFDGKEPGKRWNFLRQKTDFYSLGSNGLTIRPMKGNILKRDAMSALFCHQQHTCFSAETEVTFNPKSAKDLAGMAMLQNEEFNFVFGKTILDGKTAITLKRTEKTTVTIGSAVLCEKEAGKPVRLKIEGNGRYYNFLYATGNGEWKTLAHGVDAVNLSTNRSGGFIGACIGLYATSDN